jgi:hypothetical protein
MLSIIVLETSPERIHPFNGRPPRSFGHGSPSDSSVGFPKTPFNFFVLSTYPTPSTILRKDRVSVSPTGSRATAMSSLTVPIGLSFFHLLSQTSRLIFTRRGRGPFSWKDACLRSPDIGAVGERCIR